MPRVKRVCEVVYGGNLIFFGPVDVYCDDAGDRDEYIEAVKARFAESDYPMRSPMVAYDVTVHGDYDYSKRGFYLAAKRPNTGIKTGAAIALDGGEDCSTRGAAYA